jgi:hypothetical protein
MYMVYLFIVWGGGNRRVTRKRVNRRLFLHTVFVKIGGNVRERLIFLANLIA